MDLQSIAKWNHASLVTVASRWLRNRQGCGAVVTEVSGEGVEVPDAIGWKGYTSYLVECKVSRSDFLADQKKPFRADPTRGMGRLRWYLTPAGLLTPKDVQDTGWGILEAHGTVHKSRVTVIVPSKQFPKRNVRGEMRLMYVCLQRVQFRIHRPLADIVSWDSHDQTFEVYLPLEEYTSGKFEAL